MRFKAIIAPVAMFALAEPPVHAALPVQIRPARLEQARLLGPGWSAPATLDGQACRLIKAGQKASLLVDSWWGPKLRPAQGQMFLASVRYKDVVNQPVRFLVFAGLAPYEGLTELHRFGGLADGQWKLARVPLAWDMLMLRPGTGQTEIGLVSPGGDLPVASISIGPIDPDAEQRYNAETRQWIRRVQAQRTAARQEMARPQTPALPPDLAAAAVVPYVRSYMHVIYPYSAPQKGEVGTPLRLRMALNEYEPAAFAVYAPSVDLTNVTYRLSPLTGSAGKLNVAIEKRTAEYCLVQNRRRRSLAIFPQRLWPMYPVDIPKGRSHWFWITLKTDPQRCRPGTYRGQVLISADQGQASLPLQVQVLPIRLRTMDQAGLLMGGCTTGLVPAHELDVLREHNFNMVNIWFPGVAPRMTIEAGKLHLDFTLIDEWMKTAAHHGMKAMVWFLGGNPYGYPRTLSIEREIYIALHAGEKSRRELYDQFIKVARTEAHRGKCLPEVEPFYRQWVSRVWKHARREGWPELIMTPFDEPAKWVQGPYRKSGEKSPLVIGAGPWIRDHFKYACRLLHESAPGMRVYGSIHHNHIPPPDYKPPPNDQYPPVREGEIFLEDVDCFCTNAIDEDPSLGDKVRAAGKHFWQYSGTSAAGLPDRARFTFGFFFAAFDSRGSLVWAYNWGAGFDTTQGNNWMFAWTTPFDVIPAPYYQAMREAWDDRRYLETLKHVAALKNVDISQFLGRLAQTARALRGPGGRDTVRDFWAQAKDIAAIEQLRQRVIDKILQIQQQAAPTAATR